MRRFGGSLTFVPYEVRLRLMARTLTSILVLTVAQFGPAQTTEPASQSQHLTTNNPSLQNPQPAETLSEDAVEAALGARAKHHSVTIEDRGLAPADGNIPTVGRGARRMLRISLLMPEAVIAAKSERARTQSSSYSPSGEDREFALTVFVQSSYLAEVAEVRDTVYQQFSCDSILRVALASSASGGTIQGPYLYQPDMQWPDANAFGGTNRCHWFRAKFSLASVRRAQAAAKGSEFYVVLLGRGNYGSFSTSLVVNRMQRHRLGLE